MKRFFLFALLASYGLAACSQPAQTKSSDKNKADENTLLWRISGNGLTKPSYLFGTMHMICASDIVVSDSLKAAIKASDKVYLEVNMDDMMGLMMKVMMNPEALNMKGDTTLADLLSGEEYKAVKNHFSSGGMGSMIPFSILEKMKPFFLQAMMMEQGSKCENMIIMEQLVMNEAKKNNKKIDGLETLEFQLGVFDQIPYKLQAQQLVQLATDTTKSGGNEMQVLGDAYRSQDLKKMFDLTLSDSSIDQYSDLLLYNRNRNWVEQLNTLMKNGSLVIAVGAGHLPGDQGVINLLRKAGYKVEPVRNDMIKKMTKEI
jgi:uncharacterized protein